jgi:hypothetical protein
MNLFSFIFPGRPERYSKKKSVSYKQVGWTAGKKKNEKTMFFIFRSSPQLYTTEYLFLSVRPTRDWS